jgi:opacity protein-like surface antigen
MQKTIVSALAILASISAASAADLPSKAAPAAPSLPMMASESSYYAGVNLGGNVDSARVYSGGAVAGWNVLPFLAVEGDYDLSRPDAKVGTQYNYQNTVSVNVLPKVVVPGTPISVYGIGGIGYRWNSVSTVTNIAVFDVGVGAKYALTSAFDLDLRYRRIDALDSKNRTSTSAEDRVTAGVNYKF